MALVSDIVNSVLTYFPDAGNPLGANAYLVGLVNTIYAELMTDCHIVTSNTQVVTLTANVGEYALNTGIVRVWSALYTQAAGQVANYLTATNIDELDQNQQSWRDPNINPSFPTYYYENGASIGFWPRPAYTSVGGIPYVTIYGDTFTTLALTDPLPTTILNSNTDAFVYGVCAKFCAVRHRGDLPNFLALYDKQKSMLMRMQRGRIVRNKGGIQRVIASVRNG